jgi:hypothetical protein
MIIFEVIEHDPARDLHRRVSGRKVGELSCELGRNLNIELDAHFVSKVLNQPGPTSRVEFPGAFRVVPWRVVDNISRFRRLLDMAIGYPIDDPTNHRLFDFLLKALSIYVMK